MVRNTTAVLSQTASWLPIQVLSSENLTKVDYVPANVACNTNSVINSSILDLQKAKKHISVAENPIAPLSKQAIGTCEVSPDKFFTDTRFYQNKMYSTVQDNLYRVGTTENETTRPVPDFLTERESSPLSRAPNEMYTVPSSYPYQGEQIQLVIIEQQMYSTDGIHDSSLHVQQKAPHDIPLFQPHSQCPPTVHQHNDPVVVRALADQVNRNQKLDLKPDKHTPDPRPIVSLYDPTRPISVCLRLPRKWNGPYIDRRMLDDATCRVKFPQAHTEKAYHIDRQIAYRSRSSSSWFHRAKMKGRSQ